MVKFINHGPVAFVAAQCQISCLFSLVFVLKSLHASIHVEAGCTLLRVSHSFYRYQ